jgi:anti-sigma B factor antagonist
MPSTEIMMATTVDENLPGETDADALRIETDLTIYTALASKELLLAELAKRASVRVDLAAVGEIDTAGLQLLVLAHQEAAKSGRSLTFTGAPPAVASILELCNLHTVLGLGASRETKPESA